MLEKYNKTVKQSRAEQSQLITIFEESGAPWTKSLNVGVSLSTVWQKYSFPIRIKTPRHANKAMDSLYRLTFRPGFDEQTIELANIKLVNLPSHLNEKDISRTRLRMKVKRTTQIGANMHSNELTIFVKLQWQ
jgi:hypothetical protein